MATMSAAEAFSTGRSPDWTALQAQAVKDSAMTAATASGQVRSITQGGGSSGGSSASAGSIAAPFAPSAPAAITAPAAGSGTYTSRDLDPWAAHRTEAGTKLAAGMDPSKDPSNFYKSKLEAMSTNGASFTTDDPSYQWRLQQGQQATERSLAAKGLLNSGNAAIELQAYGQGAASQEYGAQFSRMMEGMNGVSKQYDTQMQRLMKMAGVDLDPAAQDKVDIAKASVNVDAAKANQSYDLGLRNVGVAQQQANTSGSSLSNAVISNWFAS